MSSTFGEARASSESAEKSNLGGIDSSSTGSRNSLNITFSVSNYFSFKMKGNLKEGFKSTCREATGDVVSYDIWGVACIEVEVDVLTGDYKIVRSDIIEDAGESMSPLVDIGQIEGAFVMGLGWWLTEELIYDKSTGELLTDNTWVLMCFSKVKKFSHLHPESNFYVLFHVCRVTNPCYLQIYRKILE